MAEKSIERIKKVINTIFDIFAFDVHKVDTKRLLHDKVDMYKVDTLTSQSICRVAELAALSR
jgi:hypothetical protein